MTWRHLCYLLWPAMQSPIPWEYSRGRQINSIKYTTRQMWKKVRSIRIFTEQLEMNKRKNCDNVDILSADV